MANYKCCIAIIADRIEFFYTDRKFCQSIFEQKSASFLRNWQNIATQCTLVIIQNIQIVSQLQFSKSNKCSGNLKIKLEKRKINTIEFLLLIQLILWR